MPGTTRYPADKISVDVLKGIVTLAGTVDNILARDRTVRIAESLCGVRSVVNSISVSPVKRSAAALAKDVQRALKLEPALEPWEPSET